MIRRYISDTEAARRDYNRDLIERQSREAPNCQCGHELKDHRSVAANYAGGRACRQRHQPGVICNGYEPGL